MMNFPGFRATASLSDAADSDPRARLRAMMARAESQSKDTPREDTWARRLARRWLPESWQASRVDPGKLGVLGLAAGGAIVLIAIVLGVWTQQPSAEPAPPPQPPPIVRPATTTEEQRLVVSVVGEVARPGLVTVQQGKRVADALNGAGGPLPGTDVTTLNLARKLSDGEQLYVGIPEPPPAGEAASAAGQDGARRVGSGDDDGSEGTAKVDLNAATESQLGELPGVGEVTAERIVRWRDEHGGFGSVDQLREVDGIGETRFSRLREQVRA